MTNEKYFWRLRDTGSAVSKIVPVSEWSQSRLHYERGHFEVIGQGVPESEARKWLESERAWHAEVA